MQKYMKKGVQSVTIVILVALIISSVFMISPDNMVYGANTGRIIIEKASIKDAKKGDVVPVKISLAENPGITTIAFSIKYNSEDIVLSKVENGSLLGGQLNSKEISANPYYCGWINSLQKTDCKKNGTLITLYFKIKEAKSSGETKISIVDNSFEAYNTDLNERKFQITNGSIAFKKSTVSGGGSQGTTPKPPTGNTDEVKPSTPSTPSDSSTKPATTTAEKVKKAKLSIKCKQTTAKGKKCVKVYWSNKTGVKFDGYYIYRSKKKNNGYGKKPAFITKNQYFCNVRDIRKGAKFYYKVYGYKIIDGKKVFSKPSNIVYKKVQ